MNFFLLDSFFPTPKNKKTISLRKGLTRTLFSLLWISVNFNSYAQTTILSENIGNGTGTQSIAATVFQNTGLTFTGTADTRTTGVSTGYTGASGGKNVFFTNNGSASFQIEGINTIGYTALTLSFGHFKSTIAANNELVVEVSSDGVNYSSLTYTRPTGSGTANWRLITPTGTIPATSNLRIRFRQTSSTPQFRVDDVILTGTASTCSAPTTQASGIAFSSVGTDQLTLNWTNGNGAGRVILAKEGSAVNANPSNGSNPSADLIFGAGTEIGTGNYTVFNGTGSGPITITGLNPSTTYHFRIYEYCSPDRVYNLNTATDNPNSRATNAPAGPTISTSAISGSPFCVGNSATATVSVPFTITGTFNAGNVFTAQLSDASGSFASPQNIGSITQTTSGTINATIPATVSAGTGYRIRVVSSNPSVDGSNNGSNLTIQNFAAPTSLAAVCGNQSATVSWSNPSCFDEIMLVAKDGAFSTTLPTGDGNAYTANLTFGNGTAFDGGFVVYKGTATSSGTINNLTDIPYHFKAFSRKGTIWLASNTDNCTPENVCGTENFTNLPTNSPGNYLSRSWTGTDNVTWTAEGARTDQTLTGKAVCFGDNATGNRWVKSPTYTDGIGRLKFKYVRGFTNTNARNIQVWVNGVQIGANISVNTSSNTPQEYDEVLNIPGDVEIEIRSISNGQVIVDDIEWTCYSIPCVLPTVHATTLGTSGITTQAANLSWTNGNGGSRIVVVRAGSAVNADPINNTTYLGNAVFGSGSEIGTGNYVVYKGSGSAVSISGLTPGTNYYVKIFEFGCNPGTEEYFITGTPGNTNFLTVPANPTGLTAVCKENTEIQLSWNAPTGNYDGFLLVARENIGEHVVTSLNPSSQTQNLNYASAPTFGSTAPLSRVLYIGTNNSATITGLTQNTNVTFSVYAYSLGTASTYKYSNRNSTTQTMRLIDVTLPSGIGLNEAALVSWTNPPETCFDEVLVVVNLTPGIQFSPSGDGSAYTPNPVYNTVNQVVYKADFNTNTVDVSNLTNNTTYYFEIFVRKGTQWSAGVEVSVIPNTATPFGPGDLAIVAVNTQYLSSGSDDEICFFGFKDITEGTSIEFTDNGYERASAGLWGDTEGTIRITRTAGGTITAGTTLCLRGAGNKSSDFTILNCGVNDNANWEITSLNGNLYSFDLNQNDQIWIFQNGAWSNPVGPHNATYTGNVVWGWTATGWQAAPGYNSTAGSTRPPGTQCLNSDLNGIPNNDKVKYTGPTTAASQTQWLQRINTASNWTGYSNNSTYNSGGANYSGTCVNFNIASVGLQAGVWNGFKNTDWFDCANWDNLQVPDQNTDVTLTNVTNKPIIGNGTGLCDDITFNAGSNLTMNNAASMLDVRGNWVNNSGNLSLTGNNNATVRFLGGGTKTIGGSAETYFQRLIIQNATLVNLAANARIGGNGLLEITGSGSRLGATSNVDLNIQGNSTFRLVNNGSMHDNALSNLNFHTGGNSSTATFTGNGETIKCFNFNSVKNGSGGVIFTTNSPLQCGNNFRIDYAPGTATIVDNGNTFTIGDDLRLKGNAANFNFTGTFVLDLTNSSSGQADIEIESGNTTQSIQAELHNLIINSSNNNSDVRFQGLTGNGSITIKNDFTIQSIGSGRAVQLYANTLRIGGNWTNNVGASAFNQGTSTVNFFSNGNQTISCSGGEHFNHLILSGSGIKTLVSGDFIARSLSLENDAQIACSTINSSLTLSENLTMLNNAAWTNSTFDNLDLITSGDGAQTYVGNGNPIRVFNFRSDKAGTGSLTLAANTPVDTKNNFRIKHTGTSGQFSDGGNTISLGDDLILTGIADRFNLTGTLIMTGENGDSNDIGDENDNICQAHLNNLTIQGSGSNNNTRIRPNAGNQTLTIKQNIIIQNGNFLIPGILRSQNNNINIGGNWLSYGQSGFLEGTSLVQFNGNVIQNIETNGGEAFYNLQVNNASGINLASGVQARNQLSMTQGNITTNAHILTLGESVSNPGTLNYTSGRVIGTMRRWFAASTNSGDASGLFPIGSTLHDQFVKVEYTTAPSVGGTLTTNFKAENMALFGFTPTTINVSPVGSCPSFMIDNLSEDGYWEIEDGNGLSAGNYDISFDAEGFNNINNLCELTALKRVGAGDWMESGDHEEVSGTSLRPQVKRSNASGWSNWGFAGGPLNPLPINLLHFDAVNMNDEHVQINWATASEINNDYFVVEKSQDAQIFTQVLTKKGAGYSSQVINYQDQDIEPYQGISYYRLKQVDYDGKFSYSDIIPVSFRRTDFDVMLNGNFDNPEIAHVKIINAPADVLAIVSDASGRLMNNHIILKQDAQHSTTLNFTNLKQGTYIIRFISDGKIVTKRWVR
jgi:hypothetical protein